MRLSTSALVTVALAALPAWCSQRAIGVEVWTMYNAYRLDYDVFGDDLKIAKGCVPRPCSLHDFLIHIHNKPGIYNPALLTPGYLADPMNPTFDEVKEIHTWPSRDRNPRKPVTAFANGYKQANLVDPTMEGFKNNMKHGDIMKMIAVRAAQGIQTSPANARGNIVIQGMKDIMTLRMADLHEPGIVGELRKQLKGYGFQDTDIDKMIITTEEDLPGGGKYNKVDVDKTVAAMAGTTEAQRPVLEDLIQKHYRGETDIAKSHVPVINDLRDGITRLEQAKGVGDAPSC